MLIRKSDIVKSIISSFMSDDSDAIFNETLRKDLILRVQKIKIFWIIIWVGITSNKKEFSKSLFRKKAIYKRNSESLSNIVNLANLAVEEGIRKCVTILNFVLANTKDLDLYTGACLSNQDKK
jgi:hypothetical protein